LIGAYLSLHDCRDLGESGNLGSYALFAGPAISARRLARYTRNLSDFPQVMAAGVTPLGHTWIVRRRQSFPARRRRGAVMTNDAKLGLVVGIGVVILIAIVFFRKDGTLSHAPMPPAGTVAAVPAR
jgi:hypothetical protein